MTNTYQSKKTKMKRGKYGGLGRCKCYYCTSHRERNQNRKNRLNWILKFDENPTFFEIN